MLQQEAQKARREMKLGAADAMRQFDKWEEPSDDALGLPKDNATKRP